VKGWGAGEEPQHPHNLKPDQDDVRSVEWELHHHCRQERQQQHGQKVEGGKWHADKEWEPHPR
jgi:hypothetical protein